MSNDFLLGSQLGPCRLHRLLGAGAFGRVYQATHTRLATQVAVKVMIDSERRNVLARFLREGRVMARLLHPHVARVLAMEQDRGMWFMIQEFVAGENLRSRVEREGPLPIPLAIDLSLAMASGLDGIHGVGVVHRDLKPDNVILGESELKVVDFGLSRVVNEDSQLTQEGKGLGTPLFAPLEQISGETEAIGPHSDLFSLGAVLHFMLTGLPPHAVPGDESFIALLARRAGDEDADPRLARPEVPAPLARLVCDLLRARPAERPLLGEVQDELTRLKHSKRISLRGSSQRAKASRRPRHERNPKESALPLVAGLIGAAGILLLLALLGGGESPARTAQVSTSVESPTPPAAAPPNSATAVPSLPTDRIAPRPSKTDRTKRAGSSPSPARTPEVAREATKLAKPKAEPQPAEPKPSASPLKAHPTYALTSGVLRLGEDTVSLGPLIAPLPPEPFRVGRQLATVLVGTQTKVWLARGSSLQLERAHSELRLLRGRLFVVFGHNSGTVSTQEGTIRPQPGAAFFVQAKSQESRFVCVRVGGAVRSRVGLATQVWQGTEATLVRGESPPLSSIRGLKNRLFRWLPRRDRPELPLPPKILYLNVFERGLGKFGTSVFNPKGAHGSKGCLRARPDPKGLLRATLLSKPDLLFDLHSDTRFEVTLKLSAKARLLILVTQSVNGKHRPLEHRPLLGTSQWTKVVFSGRDLTGFGDGAPLSEGSPVVGLWFGSKSSEELLIDDLRVTRRSTP
ncbi:MAG: protein kinase [Planctomycetes bacterium]|nr:protein kinase [Planctomycetota bacterium]